MSVMSFWNLADAGILDLDFMAVIISAVLKMRNGCGLFCFWMEKIIILQNQRNFSCDWNNW